MPDLSEQDSYDTLTAAYKTARASTPPLFDSTAKPAIAAVSFDDGTGAFIDKDGELITPRLQSVKAFHEGKTILVDLSLQDDDKSGIVDPSGKYIIPPFFQILQINNGATGELADDRVVGWLFGKRYAVLNLLGDLLFWLPEDSVDSIGNVYDYDIQPGFITFPGTPDKHSEKLHGLMDHHGKVLFPPTYDSITPFVEGLAAVELNRRFGYINQKGEVVIPLQLSHVSDFKDGLAMIRADGFSGLIDRTGRYVHGPGTFWTSGGIDGYFVIVENKMSGVIDRAGNWVVKMEFASVKVVPDRSLFILEKGGKFGAFFLKENRPVNFVYDSISSIDPEHFLARQDGKWMLLDNNEKPIYNLDYQEVRFFGEPHVVYFIVSNQGRWGLAEPDGKEVLAVAYDNVILNSKNQLYGAVLQEGMWGILTPELKIATRFIFNQVSFSNGEKDYIQVTVDKATGYYDSEGNELVKAKYASVSMLS